MIKSKNGTVTITGKPGDILAELSEITEALYWKKIVTAEDLIMVLAKAILEAQQREKEEIEEEEKEEETDE